MDGNMEVVIDKMAEKIGIAVEKLQPLAEETIRQYIARETAFAICGGIAVLFGLFLGLVCIKSAIKVGEDLSSKGDKYIPLVVISGIASLIFVIVGMVEGIAGLGNALAPLPGLLGL